MGVATSNLPGPWFFPDSVQIVVVLNDARNIALLQGEELSALIQVEPDDQLYHLTRESPASLSVRPNTILVVKFHAIVQGLQDTARCLGDVVLPLNHVARVCAGSLYQVWLPLQPALSCVQEEDYVDNFDKAVWKAARDPRKPMVCLSLYAGSIPQASKDYLFNASASEKADRFLGLLQSHTQHMRLLQALYREVRSNQAAQLDLSRSKDGLADSWPSEFRRVEANLGQAAPEPSGPAEARGDGEDVARDETKEALDYLREEIKATTADAEARINKAAESVTTLKDMIQAKQVELIQRRKEVSRLYHDAESVELENQKLQVQLTRASLHVGGQNQHDGEEAEQLRREAEDFHTQKEALLLILRDFYGAMGEEPPTLSAIVSKHQLRTKQLEPDGDKAFSQSSAGHGYAPQQVPQAWTNMLPRPSELLLSGVLEERSSITP